MHLAAGGRLLDDLVASGPRQRITPQVKILLRRRNPSIADPHHPRLTARVKKPVAAYGSRFLGSNVVGHRSSKGNGRLIDDHRSTRGNQFASVDRATNKETVGLSDGSSVLEAPPNPEVDRCLELRWGPRRARRCRRTDAHFEVTSPSGFTLPMRAAQARLPRRLSSCDYRVGFRCPSCYALGVAGSRRRLQQRF